MLLNSMGLRGGGGGGSVLEAESQIQKIRSCYSWGERKAEEVTMSFGKREIGPVEKDVKIAVSRSRRGGVLAAVGEESRAAGAVRKLG